MAVSGRGIISGMFCSCGRGRDGLECQAHGKHPRLKTGLTEASTNPDEVKAWWQQWPQAGVGIITGKKSGFVVVDIDVKSDGFVTLVEIEQKHGTLPETLTALTGGGGKHLFYEYFGEEVLSGGANVLGKGLDVRADGGYIVAAPSLHKSGKRYQWEDPAAKMAPLPEWIIDTLKNGRGKANGAAAPASNQPLADRLREGARNDTLFRELCALQGRGCTDATIQATAASMNQVMCYPPLPAHEIEVIVKSVLTRYPKDTAQRALTDLGNAERFHDRHGHSVRYCEQSGGWLLWSGKYWKIDEGSTIRTYAYDTARAVLHAAADAEDKDARNQLIKWARSSESRRATDAMLEQVKPLCACSPSDWDRSPWLLNVNNGTIDLRTGTLRDHRRDDYLRKIISVDYDPNVKAPHWFRFLCTIFEDNFDLIQFVQRAVGYTLTGDTSMQALFFCYGGGANGKSTFIETLAELFADYGAKFPNSLLMKQKDDVGAANPEVAGLAGVRFAHASEIERNSRMAESRVKDLTGGDSITARFLYRGFFSFKPSHKLWMYGNDKPIIRGTDEGIWRRIFLIPFLYRIPETKKVANFRESMLIPELPGILNWAVEGCKWWQENGYKLGAPQTVTNATQDYREEMDYFGEFIKNYCVVGENCNCRANEFYVSYTKWAQENGDTKPMTGVGFGRELVRRGFEKKRDMVGVIYSGIGIRYDS